jgi:hypothetical protein
MLSRPIPLQRRLILMSIVLTLALISVSNINAADKCQHHDHWHWHWYHWDEWLYIDHWFKAGLHYNLSLE